MGMVIGIFGRKKCGGKMIRISNVKTSVKNSLNKEFITELAAKAIKTNINDILSIRIAKQSVDARDKSNVFYVLTLEAEVKNQKKYLRLKNVSQSKEINYKIPKAVGESPVVVGFGPGGMFAALVLARAGLKPLVIERGSAVDKRVADVNRFWETGVLDTKSNVQFGEGGAGTFSDGKLNTGVNNPRCGFVMQEFYKHGAKEDILYMAKPHIGTDLLVDIVKNIRNEIISLGGKVLFDTQMTDIGIENGELKYIKTQNETIKCSRLILAVGHSARDTFEMLKNKGMPMERKAFSVGVRIEHKQELINKAQYGEFYKYLPAADYKLAVHLPNGRGAYTFCMCPGGVVVGAASEENTVVTNGMSYNARNGENANSALLIGVNPEDFSGDDPLAGVEFQRKLERKAFRVGGGNYYAPVQKVGDLLDDKPTVELGAVKPTYKPGIRLSDMRDIFPDYIYNSLKEAISAMDKKIHGFADKDSVVTAVESRSSSPVRILRDEKCVSTGVKGVYPCGEGCGYAGGIVSAAADGVRCAEAVIDEMLER